MPTSDLYLGLLSGTSVDAVDAVVARFTEQHCEIVAKANFPIPQVLKSKIAQLASPFGLADNHHDAIDLMGECDIELGHLFAEAALNLLSNAKLDAAQIKALCSHGQTIRHRPNVPFTLQIGDPHVIAKESGIRTIADFRRRDLAYGGQGAPLVPPFHRSYFCRDNSAVAVVNIGGIANVSLILPEEQGESFFLGYDTGPGNTLMDAWVRKHLSKDYDASGSWASSGSINEALLKALLDDPFFSSPPPKSTGREYFDLTWLTNKLEQVYENEPDTSDIQRTLLELTAISIADGIRLGSNKSLSVFVCGGGGYNDLLLKRLDHHLPSCTVRTTEALGFPMDFVEACAFAWLGYRFDQNLPIDYSQITGATKALRLGVEYLP